MAYDLNSVLATAQTNLKKPTEQQLAKAKYYGFSEEQVNQELNNPWTTQSQPMQPAPAPTPVAPAPAPTPVAPQPAPVQPAPTTPVPTTPEVKAEPKMVDTWYVNSTQVKLDLANQNKINSALSLYSTGDSLYNAVKGGSILPWTKEWTAIAQTKPEVIQQYEAVKKQKENMNQVQVLGQAIVWDVQPPQPSNALQNLLGYFQKEMDTDVASEYQNAVVNNPAYQASVQQFNGINQQIADNNKNIKALSTDVRAKYSAWTPESLIASAIAREAKPLLEQGQYLAQLQANAESEMTRILEENKDVFELKQQQISNNRNIALQLYGTIRAEEIRAEDIMRADEELQMKMEQARSEQEYNQYKDERDYNLRVGEAMQKSGQWEAEFDLKAAEFWFEQDKFSFEANKPEKWNWTIEKVNWKDVKVNKDTGEIMPITTPRATKYWFTQTANGMQTNVQSTDQIPKARRQCGAYVNDSLTGQSGWMGDSLDSKKRLATSDKPVPWSAFVMDFWSAEQPWDDGVINGHTWVVEEVRADGILVSDTNRQGTEEFTRRFIPFNSKEYGYITGYAIPPQAEWEAKQYSNIEEVQLPEKATEFSKKSFWFWVRMSQAEKAIKNMEEKFKKSTALSEWVGGKYPNWMKTGDRQAFDQAKRNFVNSVLRNESGAAISDSEFENADKQYFPQPWDSASVLEQKSQNRRTAVLNMLNSAGKTEDGENIKDVYNSLSVLNSY